ncbi:GNAT family N-acetyltransferase [Micromonospora sp. NPDC005172]|uniref:GNAT family N-acetyltransferase n=1 Tax=Micromonospora sp. NPDC005172 TaxID=3156867 RepID=UPI0033B8B6AD
MSATSVAAPRLQFCKTPGEFLAVTGDHLAADPVVSTVVTTVAHRLVAQQADGIAQPDRNWWLAVRDASGTVVGAGMRAAPFAPYPPFLLPMPDKAAVALAHALHERGEEVLAVNGAVPAVALCAAELTRLGGGRVQVNQHTRLHELGELACPAAMPGSLELAVEEDVELVMKWFSAFVGDADEQAGRRRGASAHEVPDRAELLRRLRAGQLWFWVDETGERVHLTGANPPSFGVARIGPVYTPPAQRGRGWASNAVAEVSRRIQADGARVCLFTDQANPTSNKIYAALGYRPVVDMANLIIVH